MVGAISKVLTSRESMQFLAFTSQTLMVIFGLNVNSWFSQNGSPYPGNYAIVARGVDYSTSGLGRVTFVETSSAQIGDKTYRTVVMPDGHEWMAENLDFLPSDGSIAKNPSGTLVYTAAAWYYRGDEATYGWEGKKYGLLYNLTAAKALTIAGWHLPSTTEWDALATACGGANNCGTYLKSTTDWSSGNGTDNYGFTAFPTGQRVDGNFSQLNTNAYFWTSTDNNTRYLISGSSIVSSSNHQTHGLSVRLVRDY